MNSRSELARKSSNPSGQKETTRPYAFVQRSVWSVVGRHQRSHRASASGTLLAVADEFGQCERIRESQVRGLSEPGRLPVRRVPDDGDLASRPFPGDDRLEIVPASLILDPLDRMGEHGK